MLLALQNMIKIAAFVLAALVLFPSEAYSSPGKLNLEPVWQKINGEWKFNKDNGDKYQNLVYVVTTTKNKSMKSLLTKDMVKLPFIIILDETKKEEITLH
jgi:hypothetical protein